MTTLAEAASVPAVAQILASDVNHTEVARQIRELGYPTSEKSVRRWRARQAWSACREIAAADMTNAPIPIGPDIAERGYLLSEAMRPADLPDDPVTILGYLEPYIGPGQRDLRAVRKTDSNGITTVTVTAVRDDFAEAAASLMATRIATGEGEHRCLQRYGKDRALVYWSPKLRAPLFPGSPLVRYQRFGHALIRKLAAAGWELDGNRDYTLAFERADGANATAARKFLSLDDDPAMRQIKERMRHETYVRFEGL